jgi:hypothetical protein
MSRKSWDAAMLGLLALAELGFCAQARAVCSGAITQGTRISGKAPYDPFRITGVSDQISLTVRNTGSSQCSYALAFSAPSTPAKLGATLSYDLTDVNRQSVLFATPPATPPARSIRSVPMDPHSNSFMVFTVVIWPGQLAAPGSYSDDGNANALLYGVEGGKYTLLQTASVSISYTVSQSLSVNIAGGGLATTMDFGALVKNAEKQVKIETRSNMSHHLKVSSDNHGVMALTPPVHGQSWNVPYAVSLDGKALNLNGVFSTPVTGRTTLLGDSHSLAVTIGDTAKKRAGLYLDVITIEIAPN